jgi:hypothetical protein
MTGLPDRLKYDHDKFVNRNDEVQQVLDKIQRLRQDAAVDRRTVIFHGQRGTGKSWLLQEIGYRLKNEVGVLSFYLDLADFAGQEAIDAARTAIQRVHQIVTRAVGSAAIGSYETDDLHRLAGWFIADVKQMSEGLVLLLDHVDASDTTLLEALEDHLLAALISVPDTLLVLAGRGRQYTWKRPELRIRSDELNLEPFVLNYTQEQLQKQVPDVVTKVKKIHDLGGGYPWSSYILGARLADEVDALNECIHLLLGDHEKLRPFFEALCVLRSFDEARIPSLLKAYCEEWTGREWEYAECQKVRKELVNTTLVRWDGAARGYIIDEALRPLLENHLKLNAPERWQQLHLAARQLFEGWTTRYPRAKDRWEAEARYHADCLGGIGSTSVDNPAGIAQEERVS